MQPLAEGGRPVAEPCPPPDTGRVNQYGVSVTCLLRHPVDGFYFPFTRFPAGKDERPPL